MTPTKCYHCGDDCSRLNIRLNEHHFCCEGCKTVYEILNENNLCDYYDLNEHPGAAQKIKIRADKFAFLDDKEVIQKLIHFSDASQTQVTFYLPQMHCSSCIWLLENMSKMVDGIQSARVDFTKKEVFIQYNHNKVTLRKVVELLTSIGYEPHLSFNDIDEKKLKRSQKHTLYKIGIAGFCFANIMMMSFPEYLADEGTLETTISSWLRVFMIGLSLPVLFYCANGFFISAWKGLRNKFLNIDAPIALAILITFCRSIYEISTGIGSGYLDSMSGIVFFMLIGRWLQDRTYQHITFDRDYRAFFPVAVNVVKGNRLVSTTIDKLRPNEIIQVYANELIPADAILSKGKAAIDYSFVSGESMPVSVNIGEIVYAGGKQLNGTIELMVVKEVSQSYLTNLWNKSAFKEEKANPYSFIDIMSQYFTAVLFVIGIVAAMYWNFHQQPLLMWNALTTILIVACPCALLLAATFTNGNVLRIFNQNKYYLRHAEVIENLTKINHIVFDKTGTLTQQRQANVQYLGKTLSETEKYDIASLLSQSSHPLSKTLFDFLNINNVAPIEHFKEIEGKGIEGWIDNRHIKIGSALYILQKEEENPNATKVYLHIDGQTIGVFHIANKYREGMETLIEALKPKFKISILSGDNDAEKTYLSRLLGANNELFFNQKPDEKLAYIKHLQEDKNANVLMIGDGLNDAGALRQANVGIALSDNSNNFTPACDAIMEASELNNLARMLAFAKAGKKIILFNFSISLAYNLIGLYFAVQGILSPVIAAILMPCSSISIILLTYGLSELAAKRLKLKENRTIQTQQSFENPISDIVTDNLEAVKI